MAGQSVTALWTQPGGLRLEAIRLRVDRDVVEAEGRVALLGRGLDLRATGLRIGLAGDRFLARHGRLVLGRVRLSAHDLRWSRATGLEVRWAEGTPCTCPGQKPLVTFSARRMRLAPDGRRLHLRQPTVRVAGRGIAWLPYWILPLAAGVSGLGMPQLGYSPRDGVRLALPGYLAPSRGWDLAGTVGWREKRGMFGTLQLRYFTDKNGDGSLAVEAMDHHGRFRGGVRGRATLRGRRGSVGLSPDWVTDSAYLRENGRTVQRVFAPYLRSRALGSVALGPLFGAVTADALQRLGHLGTVANGTAGRFEPRLDLLPLRLWGPLWLQLSGSLAHWEPPVDALTTRPVPTVAADRHRVLEMALDPSLRLATVIGPLRLYGQGSCRLTGLARSSAPDHLQWQLAHRIQGRVWLNAGLPLARRFGKSSRDPKRLVHTIEPFAGVQGSLVSTAGQGDEPLLMPVADGVFAAAGLRTALHRPASAEGRPLRARATVQLDIPLVAQLEGADFKTPTLAAQLDTGRLGWLSFRGEVAMALDSGALNRLLAEACVFAYNGSLCGGYWRTNTAYLGLLPARYAPAPRPLRRLPLSRTLLAQQILASARLDHGPLRLSLRLGADPSAGRLTHGETTLDLTWGCGCHSIGVVTRYWIGLDAPDIGLRLTLFRGAGSGCSR